MNLRQLKMFIATCDSGGVARAASRLHLSQPAASRQIHALEDELGIALFHRTGRRVRLTPEGELLLLRCRRVLAEVESVSESARALKRGERGILRVGATPQVIENLLAPFLGQFRKRRPGVEVHLVEDGGARLPRRLERNEIQLAIMPSDEEGFASRLLYPMHLVAVVAAPHRLAGRAVLEVVELADERLLLLTREFASRVWFEAACQVARLRPSILLESTVPQTLLALARHGQGIAVVPTPVAVPEEGLRTVPLVHRGASIGRWAVISWEAKRFLAPYAEDFIDGLVAQVRRGYPGRQLVRRAPPLAAPKAVR